jgi:NitT/TauT family transport system substrate-binding protein
MKRLLARFSNILSVVLMSGSVIAVFLQSAAAQQASNTEKQDTITIMSGVDGAYTALEASIKEGFFAKQNIDAKYKVAEDGNIALDAILTGDSDVGSTSELGIISRAARSDKIYVVGRNNGTKDLIGAVARFPFSGPKDLEGKTVGVPAASGGHYLLWRYIRKYNLDESKVHVVFLSIADTVAALKRGDIDAAFIWQPWIGRCLTEVEGSKVITWSNTDNTYNHTNYVAFSERLINNKDLGERVLRAIIDGSVWTKDHLDQASQIASDSFRMALPIAKDQLQHLDWGNVTFGPEIRQAMQEASGFLKDKNLIKQQPDLDRVLRPELMEAIAPDRVHL